MHLHLFVDPDWALIFSIVLNDTGQDRNARLAKILKPYAAKLQHQPSKGWLRAPPHEKGYGMVQYCHTLWLLFRSLICLEYFGIIFLRFSRETGLVSDCVWTPMKPARQSSHMLSHWFWVFISPQDPLWRTSALRVKSWPAQSERFGFNNATTFYDCEFPVNSTLQHVATAPNNDHLVSAPGCLWVSAATMRVQIGAGSGVVNLCPIVLYYVVYVVLCMINIDLWDYVL